MSFIDKAIKRLDECRHGEYVEDIIESTREHIEALLNTRDEYLGLLLYGDLNLNAKELALTISEKIYSIITTHEHRITILNIEYDETLAPWQLKFFLRLRYGDDTNFGMQIIFGHNRYCEVK